MWRGVAARRVVELIRGAVHGFDTLREAHLHGHMTEITRRMHERMARALSEDHFLSTFERRPTQTRAFDGDDDTLARPFFRDHAGGAPSEHVPRRWRRAFGQRWHRRRAVGQGRRPGLLHHPLQSGLVAPPSFFFISLKVLGSVDPTCTGEPHAREDCDVRRAARPRSGEAQGQRGDAPRLRASAPRPRACGGVQRFSSDISGPAARLPPPLPLFRCRAGSWVGS